MPTTEKWNASETLADSARAAKSPGNEPMAVPRPSDIRVCHISPVQRTDERAFSRQSAPAVPLGVQSCIVGPHGETGYKLGVQFVAISRIRNRALRIVAAARTVLRAIKQRADVYHVHSPEHIPAGFILKKVFSKKVIYDSREDFPAMMLTKSYLPQFGRKLARKLTLAAEKAAARHFDGFVTADPGTLRIYARTGGSRKLVFYNFPNLQIYTERPAGEKPFDLVYRGGISQRAGTFVLLDALRLLAEQGVSARLLLFGYADTEATRNEIRHRIKDMGMESQITMMGLIPQAKMAETLSSARISVCPLQRIPKFLNNIPVKVFESWACGLPVIASDLPPVRPLFPRDERDLLFAPDDPSQLATTIRALLADQERIARIGRDARRRVVERYNNRFEIQKLCQFYRGIVSA